ncbi:MAG: DUF5916 domain-containing protein [SAR86 cluster bacterium]|jgi:hypothetical protein|nr:DUF5916 domain-containing protein [SAR86 cluster bacterium]
MNPNSFRVFKIRILKKLCFIGLISISNLIQSIEIDGNLSDLEWKDANRIDAFRQILPFTLSDPLYKTEVLVYEDERGIYLGYRAYQPTKTMRANLHERDAWQTNADRVGFIIDYNADSSVAYEFSVSLGGSMRDVVFTNENNQKPDWDADWEAATSQEENVWYCEMFIPWSVAPMKIQKGDFRKVKLGFFRQSMAEGKVYATVKSNPTRNPFISLLNDYVFKNFGASKKDFFPYLTLNNDRLEEDNTSKAGAEFFWKIDSGKQLNIAINPDFGQVESDDVVVNFSNIETYYADKRPFFAENQSMFDVSGYRFFYVINTRRIGGTPDYNCEEYSEELQNLCDLTSQENGSNDIDLAVRYTQQANNTEIGFLGAFEADEDYSQGKDFYAARIRNSYKNFKVGYLGTYVESPIFDRTASVHTVDFDYKYSPELRLYGIFLNSLVNGEEGLGLRLGMNHMPNKDRSNYLGFYYFDEDLNLNDMGYLGRNDWMLFGGRTQFRQTNFSPDSATLKREYTLMFSADSNLSGDREPAKLAFEFQNIFKSTAGLELELFYRTKGKDNIITDGYKFAPYVEMPQGYGSKIEFEGPRSDFWAYGFVVYSGKGSEYSPSLNKSYGYKGFARFFPMENLVFSLGYANHKEKEWLNWIERDLLATYKRNKRVTSINLTWFRGNKHELRLKSQFVAFTARNPQAYIADIKGQLDKTDIDISSFTLSDVSFQVRYRYEILPLAYLFVVYTKGGRVEAEDEEDNLGKIYQRPWDEPTTDSFTIKLRYRF